MHEGTRRLGTLIATAAVVWHVLSVLSPAWVQTFQETRGRDFASYYYAVQVAGEGGDPYDRASLNRAARADGVRRGVHPYLYAPPFLLGMIWALPTDLASAYHLWFWLHELCALGVALVLWRWWRPLGDEVPWLIAVVVALMSAIPNNHAMGQANFPGLLLALAGLWQVERGRPWLGGGLMGTACMLKMSPALFVAWWLARRRFDAAGAAVITGAVLSLLTLPLVGPSTQLRFYLEILPTFGSGSYNGLAVPIGLFGNHSIPNLIDGAIPGGGRTLAPAAQTLSSVINLVLVGGLGWLFATARPDALGRAAQASAVGVLILLVPVYTYEHHLVFAIPAAVVSLLGLIRGRLHEIWIVPLGLCLTALLFDLQAIKGIAETLPAGTSGLFGPLKELKFLALVGLLGATTTLGVGATGDR